jgi:hypothetical protein
MKNMSLMDKFECMIFFFLDNQWVERYERHQHSREKEHLFVKPYCTFQYPQNLIIYLVYVWIKICLLWSIYFVKPYCTFQYPQNLIIYLVYVWIKICLLWSILFVHIWPSPQNYFIILLWFNSSWRRFMYSAGYYWVLHEIWDWTVEKYKIYHKETTFITGKHLTNSGVTWDRRDRHCMVVRFTTTFVISAYHHWNYEFESRSDEVWSIQHYVIKFVSDLRQIGGFLLVLRFPPPLKLHDRHDITEILLKMALNTINQPINKIKKKK